MTLRSMGVSKEEAIEYVSSAKPTYVQFETWILEKNGGKLDPDRVRQHNEAILGYNHADEKAAQMRASSGLRDDSIKDAATLNTHDDFDEFHRHIARSRVSAN